MALTDSLVAWWNLDETSGTRADSVGSNTLTDNNTVGYGTGLIDNAADFELSNSEYLSIADNASIGLSGSQYWTVSCWVKAESLSGVMGLVGKLKDDGGASSYEYGIYYSAARFNAISSNGSSYKIVTANNFGAPSTATWYHVVAYHDGSNLGIAVNAGTPNTTAMSGYAPDTAHLLTWGCLPSSAPPSVRYYWDGLIDLAGVWKRALSTAERAELYNSGAGLDPTAATGAVGVLGVTTAIGIGHPLIRGVPVG